MERIPFECECCQSLAPMYTDGKVNKCPTPKYANMQDRVVVFALTTIIFSAFQTEVAAVTNAVVLMEGASTVDSVRAVWYKPAGEVTSYKIGCSEGEALPSSVIQIGNGPFSATCVNLTTAGDVYNMTVTSLNNGERSHAAIIPLTTLPNSPFLGEGDSSVDSVSAYWYKPEGVVTSYEIGCYEGAAMPPSVKQTGDGPFSASCVSLSTPGGQYVMSVTSLSGEKRSHQAVIYLRASPSEVADLSELGATNESVSVMWTKPPGEVDSYLVVCPDGTINIEPENNDGSTHNLTCIGLTDPQGRYTVVIIARSFGKASDQATVTITLSTYISGTDVLTPTSDFTTTNSTSTSAVPDTNEIVSATVSATTFLSKNPTKSPRLELKYIIVIVVVFIVLIVVASVAGLIFCLRLRKVPSDRRLPESVIQVNHVYNEIDEVPPPFYNSIRGQTSRRSLQNIYAEPDQTDNTTGITGAGGGISDTTTLESNQKNDQGDRGVENNEYVVNLPPRSHDEHVNVI